MWKTLKLGDVASLQNGFAFKSSDYVDSGHFVMRITNVQQGYISAHNPKYISIDPTSSLARFVLNEGDILISLTGDVGRVGVLKEHHLPAVLNQRVARVTDIRSRLIEKKYLFIFLNSDLFRFQVEELARGAAQANVSTKDILSISFQIPPLVEQQRIVEKLDRAFEEIDRAIEATEECLENYRDLYKSAIKDLYFGSRQAEIVRLGEIAKIKGGKRIPKGKKLTTEITKYPYIRVSDFTDEGTIDEDSIQFITDEIRSEIARYTISSADVYVSIAGTIGKTGVIPESLDGANLTENAAKIVLDERCLRDYFYFFTTSSSFEEQAITQTRTAAQPKLALERLAKIEFPLPDTEAQKEVIRKVRAIKKKVNSNKDALIYKKQLYQNLKSAILAQELKGPES